MRARNLHTTAKTVVNAYQGEFPNTYAELLKLKGVGDYTASAIASICFDEPQPVVDGNVYRVLARYFGVDMPINSTEGINYFKALATEVMDAENIRDYNQGIMEFGAMQCTPKKPKCSRCPLNQSCVALKENSIEKLPLKLKKAKVRKRYFNYLVPVIETEVGEKRTVLQQRKGKGIWQNLWEFPLLESQNEIGLEEMKLRMPEVLLLKETPEVIPYNEKLIVHKLSHQHLHTRFWMVKIKRDFESSFPVTELEDYPVPVLIADFIETVKNSYF